MNRELLAGTPLRDIAAQFHVSSSALERHKSDHLPALMLKAKDGRDLAEGASLVEQLQQLNHDTREILEQSRALVFDGGDTVDSMTAAGLALRAIARLERQFELQARLVGQLGEAGATVVNVISSPEWVAIRSALARALVDCPECAQRVALELARLAPLS